MAALLGAGGARYTQVLSALRTPLRLALLAPNAASGDCRLACRQSGQGSPPAHWGRAPGPGLVLVLNSNGILKHEQYRFPTVCFKYERRATSDERRVHETP